MTFSILAFNPKTKEVGCAAATGNLAVGAWVLRADAQAGAAASQGSSASVLWGDSALRALSQGQAAEQVIQTLTAADQGSEYRQLTVLDLEGRSAAFTGASNEDYKGSRLGLNYAIAGNWLSNAKVLTQMEEVFLKRRDQSESSLDLCLLEALEVAYQAGGDARGLFSAALKVVSAQAPPLDLRIDYDQRNPLERLRTLHKKATSPPYSTWVTQHAPTLNDPYKH